MTNKLGDLKQAGENRDAEILDLEDKLQNFLTDLRQVGSNIDLVKDDVSEQPPISGDVQIIQDQQDDLKVNLLCARDLPFLQAQILNLSISSGRTILIEMSL